MGGLAFNAAGADIANTGLASTGTTCTAEIMGISIGKAMGGVACTLNQVLSLKMLIIVLSLLYTGAYGIVNPIGKRIDYMHKANFTYYNTMAKAISGFAKGLAPIMAVEIARRGLDEDVKPEADELEKMLKALNSSGGASS